MKKTLSTILTTIMAISLIFSAGVAVSAKAKKPTKITAVSKKTISVTAGKQFELKVKANGNDNYLYWTITKGKDIVKFDDRDRSDDDIDLIAKKAGTAKVVCRIKGTNKKITFTVKVKKLSKVFYISASKAKSIAFKNAGVSASKVKRLKVERDKDNSRLVYEVSFDCGRYEYDYEIDANTGKILDKDKDLID